MLKKQIFDLLENNMFLTHVDIAKIVKKDKSKVSGYLEAMVDYGKISMKKYGNPKIYFHNNKRKE